jgi:hypothetical protein
MLTTSSANGRVPLLATILLALDDEAEQVGAHLVQLSHSLDPLIQSRLRLLRVSGTPGQLVAAPLVEAGHPATLPASNIHMQLDVADAAYARVVDAPVDEFRLANSIDPNATQLPVNSNSLTLQHGTFNAFPTALRTMLQNALRTGGSQPLTQHGYALVPNEMAIYIVGRIDSPLLADVAHQTHEITRSIANQTDARRFAILIAAPPDDEQHTPISTPHPAQQLAPWQKRAQGQPWHDLLSWKNHEPPLLYAFLYEAWDEAGHFHPREDLHYVIAESLYSLFITGILEQPKLKDALDLSTAALDSKDGLSRIGSIGTSIITGPDSTMLDYLANRLAADVLIRRGLLGLEAGISTPRTHASLLEEAQKDAEKWIASQLRTRLVPEQYPLPRQLPPREIEDGRQGGWHNLALSTASPDPAALLWRWATNERFYLNDERYWNLTVQHEYETSSEVPQWNERLRKSYDGRQTEIMTDLEGAIRWRTLGIQGAERARAFVHALSSELKEEGRLLEEARAKQQADIERHYRSFEDELRRVHNQQGVPLRPNPPENASIPAMPRNMEALSHEVVDERFSHVPQPLTLLLMAALFILFGALAADPVAHLPFVVHLPKGLRSAFASPQRYWTGAGVMAIVMLVGMIPAVIGMLRLRRWQRRYSSERTLLWLAYAKERERAEMAVLVANLQIGCDRLNGKIDDWMRDIAHAAARLNQAALDLRDQVATAAISRDIIVAEGVIWEGVNPDDFYAHVREGLDEGTLTEAFLRHVESHSGDVVLMLREETIGSFALEFMRDYLRQRTDEHPFTMWDAVTANDALERAIQAARVPFQPQIAGSPLGHVEVLSVQPDVAWIGRLAEERGMVVLPTSSDRQAVVTRVITRAQQALIR